MLALYLGALLAACDSGDKAGNGTVATATEAGPGRIAFWQEGQGDEPNLFVMAPDPKARLQGLVKGFDLTWSPDGKRIAFAREEETSAPTLVGDWGIWVLSVANPDSLRRLTPETVYAEHPAWSPDGTTIAFSGFVRKGDIGRAPDVFVMPAAGGMARAITDSPDFEEEPSWSPDGREILYSRFGEAELDSPDLWVMNADGSEQHAITQTPDYDYSPAWSPDGENIAFQRQYPPFDGVTINNEIVVVNRDGSNFRRLTRNKSFDDRDPAWSPDGDQIVFVSDRTGVAELFVMHPDGSQVSQLTEHSAAEDFGGYNDPKWGPSP